jgi:hypothetical protein
MTTRSAAETRRREGRRVLLPVERISIAAKISARARRHRLVSNRLLTLMRS